MDTKRLILYLVAIVVLAPLIFAIATQHPPAPIGTVTGPSVYWSNSFGGGNLQVFANLCAGKVRLTQGSATLSDSCFTGDTNIVICSDITSANLLGARRERAARLSSRATRTTRLHSRG